MDLKLDGKRLAELYCGNCHIEPEPSILDQKTWEESVLPDMRMRMGLYLEKDFGVTLPQDKDVPPGIYSEIPLIKRQDWEKLEAYYLKNAPENPLPQVPKKLPSVGIQGFEVLYPEFDFVFPDLTTMISVDSTSSVWLGHRFRKLFRLNLSNNFEVEDSISTAIAPVSIRIEDNSFELLSMGLMDPSNDSLGTLTRFSETNSGYEERTMQRN